MCGLWMKLRISCVCGENSIPSSHQLIEIVFLCFVMTIFILHQVKRTDHPPFKKFNQNLWMGDHASFHKVGRVNDLWAKYTPCYPGLWIPLLYIHVDVVHLNWTAIPFHNHISSLSSLTFKPYVVDGTLKSRKNSPWTLTSFFRWSMV